MQASRIQCSLSLLRSERCLGRVYYKPKRLGIGPPQMQPKAVHLPEVEDVNALEPTGERLLTDDFNDNTIEHLHRYAFALQLCKGKDVLDIASGEGYGSNLIAGVAKSVLGVDISKAAVCQARKKYERRNLKFIEGSASDFPVESSAIDVVVS